MQTTPSVGKPMAKEELKTRQDAVGTSFGVLIFLTGIGLLAFVFLLALGLFKDPGVLTAMATTPASATPAAEGGSGVTGALIGLGVKVVALFIMALSGSLVTSKGIHLYLASR